MLKGAVGAAPSAPYLDPKKNLPREFSRFHVFLPLFLITMSIVSAFGLLIISNNIPFSINIALKNVKNVKVVNITRYVISKTVQKT